MLSVFFVWAFSLLVGVSGHSSIWHPSMFGFNVTAETFPYDNRPVAPLRGKTFQEWWFHNHLDYPPHPGDVYDLQAGKPAMLEIACHKAATSYFASSEGGDIRDPNNPNYPCPGAPTTAFHANDINDLMGCGLAIAYKSDARQVKPEDFTMFSVNHTCVWNRFTDFQVPEKMPPCPEGGCVCAFFWIHSPKSGGEENYMNGFKCNVSGSTSTVPVAKSKVARRCGADPENGKLAAAPGNCTYGAKQPFYWLNLEQNNVFEGEHSPPVYNDLYNFLDGAQDDIFEDSYISIPDPSPNAPLPVRASVTNNDGNKDNTNTSPPITPPSVPSSGNGNGNGNNTNTTPSAPSTHPKTPERKCFAKKTKRSNDDATGAARLTRRRQLIEDMDVRDSNGSAARASELLVEREIDQVSVPRVLSPAALVAMSKRSRRLHLERRDKLWKIW